MHNLILNLTTTNITTGDFLTYTAISLVLGAVIAIAFKFKNTTTKGFSITLALLPAIIQVVIMLVNGNLGTGVAVMGAFSLVRFRSVPGNARDICSIFLAMAVGLATGTGYVLVAIILVAVICGMNLLYNIIPFGESNGTKQLLITIPESLDYNNIFDDLFEKYTSKCELVRVKTTNLGSLYRLTYDIVLKKSVSEKDFIDELRCRNGNLEISCGRPISSMAEQL